MALAGAIIGVASIVDGDTLDIHGQRIRLHGVDAPESRQTCHLDGKPWRCGVAAANALSDFTSRRTVSCESVGRDRYKRVVARCYVDGVELGMWLVESGWALDYDRYSKGRYSNAQKSAEKDKRGIWASEFEVPWAWRKR